MAATQELLIGEGAGGAAKVYIEDVFSTYLYTGNGSTQTITNNIDLSTKGGLVWIKNRAAATDNILTDSARGTAYFLRSNTTNAQDTNSPNLISGFNTTGFGLGASSSTVNGSSVNYASWTFRKQPKFFDIVTYTGDGSASRAINHNLGSVPGCVIVKCTSSATPGGGTAHWPVYHRGLNGGVNPEQYAAYLNLTNDGTGGGRWANTAPTSTQFYVNNDQTVNTSGQTYVAYLFAHDAGGFGLTGTDNVISCGSYTGNGSATGPTITLGYEPQWIMIKQTNDIRNWAVFDNMRGIVTGGIDPILYANTSGAEITNFDGLSVTATGFQPTNVGALVNASGGTYIYIAIRRGPMKVPTDGTTVFKPTAATNTTGTAVTTNFPIDMQMFAARSGDSGNTSFLDRLRGYPGSSTDTTNNRYIVSSSTAAETTTTVMGYNFWNTSFLTGPYYNNVSSAFYSFQRAPSFFDEVCYTGTGANRTVTHNLGVAPDLIIVKKRGAGIGSWYAYVSPLGATKYMQINSTGAVSTSSAWWNDTAPTSTVFTVGTQGAVNGNTDTFVAYLFATCAGVSKVGSFVLSGSDQTINCGFAAGARFILLKDTGTAGRNWHVWDTARGINSGATEPYLDLNTTAAESTIRDWIEPNSSGFTVKAAYAASEGGTGQTFIYLAIA